MRVRGFTQDDAHIFCTEDQIAGECLKIIELILSTYADFGFEEMVGQAVDPAREARRLGRALGPRRGRMLRRPRRDRARSGNAGPTGINPGEGAFYGPKFEYVLRDAIGRDWQCGTTQLDFILPERFGAFYVDTTDGKKTAGDDPPRHLRLDGALHRHPDRALRRRISRSGSRPCRSWWRRSRRTPTTSRPRRSRRCAGAGLRVETDLRNEKINYKVREHSLAKVPVMLVVGRKEAEERTVSVRRLGSPAQRTIPLEAALRELGAEALPPDRRAAAAALDTVPEAHLTLDSHHGRGAAP